MYLTLSFSWIFTVESVRTGGVIFLAGVLFPLPTGGALNILRVTDSSIKTYLHYDKG